MLMMTEEDDEKGREKMDDAEDEKDGQWDEVTDR